MGYHWSWMMIIATVVSASFCFRGFRFAFYFSVSFSSRFLFAVNNFSFMEFIRHFHSQFVQQDFSSLGEVEMCGRLVMCDGNLWCCWKWRGTHHMRVCGGHERSSSVQLAYIANEFWWMVMSWWVTFSWFYVWKFNQTETSTRESIQIGHRIRVKRPKGWFNSPLGSGHSWTQ